MPHLQADSSPKVAQAHAPPLVRHRGLVQDSLQCTSNQTISPSPSHQLKTDALR